MFRIIAHAALLAGALVLGGCGFADSRAPVPEFMRLKEAEQPQPEPPPDVKRVVREQIDIVFLTTSYPREVHVAPPHHEVRGPGWTACVRAQLTSATGSPLGMQTYIVRINGGKVVDRRRAEVVTSASQNPTSRSEAVNDRIFGRFQTSSSHLTRAAKVGPL